MRSTSYLPQMLTVVAVAAAVVLQAPWGFPLGREFVATSVNGQILANNPPTLTVTRDGRGQMLHAVGFTGCNSWNGEVMLNQSRIGVGNVGTTKIYCAEQMAAESDFLTALQTVKRWHMDGPVLVLEGDQTTLQLTPINSANP